jgi:hypothetical protein
VDACDITSPWPGPPHRPSRSGAAAEGPFREIVDAGAHHSEKVFEASTVMDAILFRSDRPHHPRIPSDDAISMAPRSWSTRA